MPEVIQGTEEEQTAALDPDVVSTLRKGSFPDVFAENAGGECQHSGSLKDRPSSALSVSGVWFHIKLCHAVQKWGEEQVVMIMQASMRQKQKTPQ